MFDTSRSTSLYDHRVMKKAFTARGNPNTMLTPSNYDPDSDLGIAEDAGSDYVADFSANAGSKYFSAAQEDVEWFRNALSSLGSLPPPPYSDLSSPISSIPSSRSDSPLSTSSTCVGCQVSPSFRPCAEGLNGLDLDLGEFINYPASRFPSPPLPPIPTSPTYSDRPVSTNANDPAVLHSSHLEVTEPSSGDGSPLLSPLHDFSNLPEVRGSVDQRVGDWPLLLKTEPVEESLESIFKTTASDGAQSPGNISNAWEDSDLARTFARHTPPAQRHSDTKPTDIASSSRVPATHKVEEYDEPLHQVGRRRAAVVTIWRLKALSDMESADESPEWQTSSQPISRCTRTRKNRVVAAPYTVPRERRKMSRATDEDNLLAAFFQTDPEDRRPGPFRFSDLNIDPSKYSFAFSPLECDSCVKGFQRIHDLKRHLRTIHRFSPYKCNVCGTEFCRSDAVTRHLAGGVCKGPGKKRKRRMMKWEVEKARKEKGRRRR